MVIEAGLGRTDAAHQLPTGAAAPGQRALMSSSESSTPSGSSATPDASERPARATSEDEAYQDAVAVAAHYGADALIYAENRIWAYRRRGIQEAVSHWVSVKRYLLARQRRMTLRRIRQSFAVGVVGGGLALLAAAPAFSERFGNDPALLGMLAVGLVGGVALLAYVVFRLWVVRVEAIAMAGYALILSAVAVMCWEALRAMTTGGWESLSVGALLAPTFGWSVTAIPDETMLGWLLRLPYSLIALLLGLILFSLGDLWAVSTGLRRSGGGASRSRPH